MIVADHLTPCQSLSGELRGEAAELVVDAMSALYDPIRSNIVPILASEFLLPESELGDGLALLGPGVEGLVAHYPAEELAQRQRASLHHSLGGLDSAAARLLIAQLRREAGMMPNEPAYGQYIARFAIPPSARGTGVSDRLLALFAVGRPAISLHVRTSNLRAIGFYRRHGFVEAGKSDEFLLMTRS